MDKSSKLDMSHVRTVYIVGRSFLMRSPVPAVRAGLMGSLLRVPAPVDWRSCKIVVTSGKASDPSRARSSCMVSKKGHLIFL